MTAVLRALTGAIGREDNLLAGMRMTRLAQAATVGATTLTVESTLDFPTPGALGVDGVLYAYTGKTNTTFTGVSYVAGGVSTPGTMHAHAALTAVLDVSGQFSQIDLTKRRFLLDYADGDDLTALGTSLSVTRANGMTDDAYRALVKAAAYSPRGTLYGLKLALDALLGPSGYVVTENLITAPSQVSVSILRSALAEATSRGKLFLEGRKAFEARPVLMGTNLLAANVASGTDTLGNTTGFTATGNALLTSDTAYSWTGNRSLKCVCDAANTTGPYDSVTVTVPCTPGVPYTFSVWARGPGVRPLFELFTDAPGGTNRVFVHDPGREDLPGYDLSNTWQRLSLTLTPAANATQLTMMVSEYQFHIGGTFWTDGWALEQAATASPWTHEITLDTTPLALGSVSIRDENVVADCSTQKPSATTQVEYTGQAATPAWACVVGNEAAVTVDTALRACHFNGTPALYYERLARLTPGCEASFDATLMLGATPASSTDARGAALVLDDQARIVGVGAVAVGVGSIAWRFFNPSTGGLLGSQVTTHPVGTMQSVRLRKRADAVELYVDGRLLDSLALTSFPASSGAGYNAARFGILTSQGSAPDLYVANVALWTRCPDDLLALTGAVSSVASAQVLNLGGWAPDSGDVGSILQVRKATSTATQGVNAGTYLIEAIPGAGQVQLQGALTAGTAVVESARPTRLTVGTRRDRPFTYPDDLGKTVVVSGSTLGNNGSFTIAKILDPYTLTDLALLADGVTPAKQKLGPVPSNVVELTGATFVTETGLSVRLNPAFTSDGNSYVWAAANNPDVVADVVRLRNTLPVMRGTVVVDVLYAQVLSAEVLLDNTVLNADPDKSPIYIADPSAYVQAYINDLLAAGVSVSLSFA